MSLGTEPQNIFRAIHLGDLHFWRIPLNPLNYFGKRLLGVGNLVVGGRARKFRQRLAPQLIDHLRTVRCDAMLFSGDFSSVAASGEFRAARRYFEPVASQPRLGSYSVPGNHDCYVSKELSARKFQHILGKTFRPTGTESFTHLHDGIYLLAFNATTRNGLGSHGRLTPRIIDFVTKQLEEHSGDIRQLWILCHFPPEEPPGVLHKDRGVQLKDSQPLLDVLSSLQKPTLFLHGHHHYRWLYGSPTVSQLTYVNAGAPFLRHGTKPPDLGFHEIQVDLSRHEVGISTHYLHAGDCQWKVKKSRLPEPGEYCNLQDI